MFKLYELLKLNIICAYFTKIFIESGTKVQDSFLLIAMYSGKQLRIAQDNVSRCTREVATPGLPGQLGLLTFLYCFSIMNLLMLQILTVSINLLSLLNT